MGLPAEIRRTESGEPVVTDNGNLVLDCKVGPIESPAELDTRIQALPGVVGTGLFVGMADAVVVQRADRVDVLERAGR
jgi:ribose 5-phosphate isomerase A